MSVHAQSSKNKRHDTTTKSSQPTRSTFDQTPETEELLRLQRSIGNQAVQRLISSRDDSPMINVSGSAPKGTLRRDDDDPPAPVPLTKVSVNHERVTVPSEAGLSFAAATRPANATDVTFKVQSDSTTIDAGTTINADGDITVAAGQTGGLAEVEATQKITEADGSWTSSTQTSPFNFTAIPSGITSTDAVEGAGAGKYGGEFTHTFTSPGGGQAALERSRVNEFFPAASGTTLSLSGPMGAVAVTVNNPTKSSAGWDLDSDGMMVAADHVTWGHGMSVTPFFANASNPKPKHTLPQELVATQEFRNRSHPSNSFGTKAVTSTTHRRAFELRGTDVMAVTSANGEEVVEDYVGPTAFINAKAAPASVPATGPTPEGGEAPEPTTTTISVDTRGPDATPTFSIQGPKLGSSVDSDGEFTPGTTAGTVTVRAGDRTNYDEVDVTITAPPAAESENTGEQDAGTE